MRSKRIHRVSRLAIAFSVMFASIAFVPLGCGPQESDRLVVATSWPEADRLRIEEEFAGWVRTSNQDGLRSVRLEWLIITPGDNVDRLAVRRNPPDVLLGGPASTFERLGRMNRLSPLPIEGSPSWSVARRTSIRLAGSSRQSLSSGRAIKPQTTPGPAGEIGPDAPDAATVAFDDPRNDPISLAWAKGLVRVVPFRDGYSRLIRLTGHSCRIGRQSGSARAAVDRGDADLAPAVITEAPTPGGSPVEPWVEGVAILASAPHPDRARLFLQFLGEAHHADSDHRIPENPAASSDLLAELLGATMVDAQDELWAAWTALEREGYPEHALRWLTEPPPWPPASVARMMTGAGEHGMPMVETLARQLATEPTVRAWLVRSWLSPRRQIDEKMIDEIARAADGRLLHEPRFRDWLREEWTAWARQRYRRVARLASSPAGRGR